MANPRKLSQALQYVDARQQALGSLGDLPPNFAPAGSAPSQQPEMSWLDRLAEFNAGAGAGLANQVTGLGEMVTDPIGTAKGIASGVVDIAKNPALVVAALKAMGEKAMASPAGFGEVVGENLSLNPRKLVETFAHPNRRELIAAHGTPHRFPPTANNPLGEFDASKIGTGEGAQAYGHGLYLAENPAVATEYKTGGGAFQAAIPSNNVMIDGTTWAKTLPKSSIESQAAHVFSNDLYGKTIAEKIAVLRKGKMEPVADWLEKNSDRLSLDKGSLYTVDLPDEKIAQMLDYDKPINEQSKYVKDALEAAGINSQSSALAGPMAKGQESHLQKHGIPGIKYLDEGSRGNGSIFKKFESKKEAQDFAEKTGGSTQIQPRGESWVVVGEPKKTRNFVVFPGEEKHLKILERK